MLPTQVICDDLKRLLSEIKENLEQINTKLDKLIQLQEADEYAVPDKVELQALDVMTLLSFPDHLRKTAMILNRLGRATADQVSKESRRARAVESSYLNRLVVMGYVKKTRKGREVFFHIE